MIDKEVFVVRDGAGTRTFVRVTDTSHPPFRIEDCQYKFNWHLELLGIDRALR